jgi:signal transduction histidine kinase
MKVSRMKRSLAEWGFMLSMLVLLGAGMAWRMYVEWEAIDRDERDRLATQARVLHDNIVQQLNHVNLALVGLRDEFTVAGQTLKSNPATLNHRLNVLRDALPGVRTLLVIDAKGRAIASTRKELIGKDFHDRAYFQQPLAQPDPQTLYASPPYKTVLGVWGLNVTRMIPGAKGEFAGAVTATLDKSQFSTILNSVLYSDDARAALVHGSGMVFHALPPRESVEGKNLDQPGTFFRQHRESGKQNQVFAGSVLATRDTRMLALHTLRPAELHMDQPLVVAVNRLQEAVFARWRRDALYVGVLYAFLVVVSILSLTTFQRRRSMEESRSAAAAAQISAGQQRLELATRAAEAANQSKGRFLATMSHEIRTPMNAILGMAQLLQQPALTEDRRQTYVRTILSSGQTLLALLNDILDVSKVDAGKLTLERIAFAPGELIHGIGSLFHTAADSKGLRLKADWHGPAGQEYLGDPRRLHQMLSNLANNAIKFTAQGVIGIEGRELERDDATALLEFFVSDSGIGIAQDKHALLFQAFSQADDSTTRRYGGTGLGLSIVRGLAKEMGGEVGVESQVGHGARFWFRVRVGLGQSSENAASAPEASTSATRRLTGRVLVVDDSPINLTLVDAFLETVGLDYDHAANGQQAVEQVCRESGDRPDLILMDVQMPVLNGFAATRRIREWEAAHERPRIPIVALTAGVFEDDRNQCLTAGMDGFLPKPVQFDDLAQVLSQWLKPAEAQEAASSFGSGK